MEKNISPEERLLLAIKGKQKKADPQARGQSGPQYILKPLFSKNKLFEPRALKSLNKYLVMIFLVLVLYLIWDILVIKPSYRDTQEKLCKKSDIDIKKAVVSTEKDVPVTTEDYSRYSKEISAKKIFGAPPIGQEGLAPKEEGISEDISKNLGLVGIIAGENPQAIIEDKKTQKTYYLRNGESFDGFTVDGISEGKVILEHEGKKIALFL